MSFLYGSLIGGLVGAAIATLLAPTSGNELREQLQMRAERFQIEVKNAAATRRAELEQQLDYLRMPRKTQE
jgi:gas vesicle protein